MDDNASINFHDQQLACHGDWSRRGNFSLANTLDKLSIPSIETLHIQGNELLDLDTSGAWLLQKFIQRCQQAGLSVELTGFKSEHSALIDLVARQGIEGNQLQQKVCTNILERIGVTAVAGFFQVRNFLAFFGEMFIVAVGWLLNPTRIRWVPLLKAIQNTGYNALLIVGLLSFLIGIVLAYQVGLQLINYGANIFVVDLVGISLFREFAPLITAVILAGRTGSAYTAQIGTMKLNEEVDAILTLGLSPMELLVLPRVFALLIALPLLSVWADILGVLGGMFMSKGLLDVAYDDFLSRFVQVIDLKTFFLGLIKAPVFAVVIAGIGCFQGFQVRGSADSVGICTTKSVVQGIFMIIVVDAAFSVLYGNMGI